MLRSKTYAERYLFRVVFELSPDSGPSTKLKWTAGFTRFEDALPNG